MRVSQDTRTIKKGEWFVAVKGGHFDGHSFIEEALEKGAAGVLEERDLYELAKKKIKDLKPKVIAVTGSYGKTTTKEAIYKVLSARFKVQRTFGNLNTPLGVAMEAVNNLKPAHQIFVAEVGMDYLGEIRQSCMIINPRVGIVTAVGEMHLEKLETLRNIKKAKSELFESLPANGIAVLNCDDANVTDLARRFGGRKIWYGFSPKAEINDTHIKDLKLWLLGEGSKYSVLAAYAVGQIFGVPKRKILKALKNLKPQKGRLNLVPGRNGVRIIDDTYNAGPRSMKLALGVLREFSARKRIAVLGDMLELGKLEKRAHRETIETAVEVADRCILVGPKFLNAAAGVKMERKSIEAVADSWKAMEIIEKLELGK